MNSWMWMILQPFVAVVLSYVALIGLALLVSFGIVKIVNYFLDTRRLGW